MLEAPTAGTRDVLAEAIEGWRTWTVVSGPGSREVRLSPIAGTGRLWPPRRPVRAECGRRRRHRVPGPECTCGIHATRETDLLRRTCNPGVVGTVALWGRVVEHEHGFRAEYGYPQRLALVCPLCFWQWGTARSKPPIAVARRGRQRLMPLCEPHLELWRRLAIPSPTVVSADEVERRLLATYAVDVLRFAEPGRGSERQSGSWVVR